jgi:hypothetical protein
MVSDKTKTDVLYQIKNYKVFINEYNEIEQEAIKELLKDGYLRNVSNNLQLTNKANNIVMFNLDYISDAVDFKKPLMPNNNNGKTPNNTPEINKHRFAISWRWALEGIAAISGIVIIITFVLYVIDWLKEHHFM